MSLFNKTIWLDAVSEESFLPLSNPWRGMYQLAKYLVEDDADSSEEAILTALDPIKKDTRLILLEINIGKYRANCITAAGLSYISEIFKAYRRTNKQLIVRFLYDWDGNGLLNEPARFDVVLQHVKQVGSIMSSNANQILTHQGVLVGSWGEMHSSKFLSGRWLTAMISEFVDATQGKITISVRSPAYWRLCSGKATPSWFDVNVLGIYNDGIFGSETDLGSYGYLSLEDNPPLEGKLTREEELDFQGKVGLLAPIGGEVVFGKYYSEYENAIADLAKMHVSYMNRDYDEVVYTNWRNTKNESGMSGYDYLETRIGYRYVIRKASVQRNNLVITIENVGFAPIYTKLEAELVLRDDGDNESTIALDADCRSWLPNKTISISAPLPAIGKGVKNVSLRLVDPALTEEIQFANNNGGQLGRLVQKK